MESFEAEENGGRNLNSGRHKHELFWAEGLSPYTCKGCKHFGANKGYKCRSCAQFVLHKVCANSRDEESHNNVQLRFRRRTKGSHSCDACGEFLKGFLFQSLSSELRLHPLCMVLPDTFTYSGHPQHSVKLVRESESEYRCSHCFENYSGWRYRCEQTSCRLILDLNCCIIDIHDQRGITKVVPCSRRKRIARKLLKGGKSLTGTAMKGTVEGVGTGLAAAAVGGVVGGGLYNNDDDEAEEGEGEEEEEAEEEPEDYEGEAYEEN